MTQALTTTSNDPGTETRELIKSHQFHEAISNALPKFLTPERFVKVALTCLIKTPLLAKCTQESILKTMVDISSLGLEPDGRRCHLIPFFNSKKNCHEAQLIVDYKGLIELAKRSGEVVSWRAEIVCDSDVFSWENGEVNHKIDFLKPRGKLMAVYSHVKNDKGLDDYEVMNIAQVEDVRSRSKASDSGPWVTDFCEMAKKTVIRRHSKRLNLSPEFTEALDKDFDRFEDIQRAPEKLQGPISMPRRIDEPPPAPPTPAQDQPKQALDAEVVAKEQNSVKINLGLIGLDGLRDPKTKQMRQAIVTLEKDDDKLFLDTSTAQGAKLLILLKNGKEMGASATLLFKTEQDGTRNITDVVPV